MDIHNVPGVKAKDVASAHRQDLLHQDEHACKCMTYWIDETRESIFCLIEAPNKEAVVEMHDKAHGLVPNKIIEVDPGLVESFLGRIYDPSNAVTTDDGLKIFSDPSFRVLLVTRLDDPLLLQHQWGIEKANEFIARHNTIIRNKIAEYRGSEAENRGAGFIISFSSASNALSCAIAIKKELGNVDRAGFRMALNAGEAVEKSQQLFGDTIAFAKSLCQVVADDKIAIATSVRELLLKDPSINNRELFTLPPADEEVLQRLFGKLDEHWQDAAFDVEDYAKAMALSKSQLYRKTIALTGSSPNILLKDYRLELAKELMKKKRYSISQITFESGFTSPSYFTKCFKKKYGLLPMEYINHTP
jgi:AraC-like DNA-binding protein